MKCVKCGAEMKSADMLTGMHQTPAVCVKRKNVWDSSKIACRVCPQCGYIELKAEKPELFQNA